MIEKDEQLGQTREALAHVEAALEDVLSRCECGRDDYSLQVANLPGPPPKPGQQDMFAEEPA